MQLNTIKPSAGAKTARRRVGRGIVGVAKQMQGAVHDQVGQMRQRRLVLLGRLANHDRQTDHQVPELRGQLVRQPGGGKIGRWKGQHIGRTRLGAPALVELTALVDADQPDRQLAVAPAAGSQHGCAHPGLEVGPVRHRCLVGDELHINVDPRLRRFSRHGCPRLP